MQPGYLLRNRYSIQQQLASGYFGNTYLAIDRDYYGRRFVVVKHLKPQSTAPAVLEIARRLFETEAMTLRRLGEKTDRVPQLHAYFEELDEFYLVQEFIEGQTLAQELTGKKLTTLATIHILHEILTGLSIVHAENIIHRDLKPDNIIRRKRDRVLVTIDFGAVKEVSQATLMRPNPKTLASIGFGTEGYMPSEQAMGFPKPASDIYAVGAIGIECLTGREPHELFDEETLEFNWRHLYRVSDPKIDPLIEPLAQVLNKMLRQRYRERYANATEALQAIEALLQPQPPQQLTSRSRQRGTLAQIDRAAFLKLMGVGGFGAISLFVLPRIFQYPENKPASQKIGSGTMAAPTTIEFTSVKLNERGDIIDTPTARARIFQEELAAGIFLTMVEIPAGEFLMGASPTEVGSSAREQPQHQVKVPRFFMGQTQVTQAQWAALFPGTPVGARGNDRLPVYSVNWLDAIAFCERLSQKTGHRYRLPTEAEWEYACRANTTTPFGYGDTLISSVANYNGEHPYGLAPRGEFRQQVTPVAKFPPNRWGLYDMHGNVWEWCLDEWFENYQGAPSDGSARGNVDLRDAANSADLDDRVRVVRGGSWFSHGNTCRAASRTGLFGLFRHDNYGLRVVCEAGD
jgi:eukaryotic-like serine/threonine-protein kinase